MSRYASWALGGSTGQRDRTGSAGELAPLSLSLPVDPAALSGARSSLGGWLGAAGVCRRDIDDVLIAANEACMNAVEHSGTPAKAGIQVLARRDGERLWMEVRDRGRWREPVSHPDRGHGLGLMRALTDGLAIEREDSGTTVVMEKALRFRDAAGLPVS